MDVHDVAVLNVVVVVVFVVIVIFLLIAVVVDNVVNVGDNDLRDFDVDVAAVKVVGRYCCNCSCCCCCWCYIYCCCCSFCCY